MIETATKMIIPNITAMTGSSIPETTLMIAHTSPQLPSSDCFGGSYP